MAVKKSTVSNWDKQKKENNAHQLTTAPNAGNTEDSGIPKQLPPIVQPIAFVPYSTVNQPLFQQVDPEQGYYDDSYANDGDVYEASAGKKNVKKVSVASILMIILSLATILVIVLGKFIDAEFLMMYGSISGLDVILEMPDAILGEFTAMLLPLGLTLVALTNILVLILSIISVKAGVRGFTKFLVFVEAVGAGIALVMMALKGNALQYGAYIVAGIAAVQLLIALFSRKK